MIRLITTFRFRSPLLAALVSCPSSLRPDRRFLRRHPILGRIGRIVLRNALLDNRVNVVAINE